MRISVHDGDAASAHVVLDRPRADTRAKIAEQHNHIPLPARDLQRLGLSISITNIGPLSKASARPGYEAMSVVYHRVNLSIHRLPPEEDLDHARGGAASERGRCPVWLE